VTVRKLSTSEFRALVPPPHARYDGSQDFWDLEKDELKNTDGDDFFAKEYARIAESISQQFENSRE
jgi:hypothetical protein